VLVAIVLCIATAWAPRDLWAGLGQWVGGIGALAAVTVALHIAGGEARRAELDRYFRRREKLTERREAELARAAAIVSAVRWVDDWNKAQSDAYTDMFVEITNHGAALILKPRVEGFADPTLPVTASWEIALDAQLDEYVEPADRLPAGTSTSVRIAFKPRPNTEDAPCLAVISYTLDGFRWRRTGLETPVRVDEDDESHQVGGPFRYHT
jgi:hypothetical protein